MADKLTRTLPEIGPDTAFFWTAGASGRLEFLQCRDCDHYIHPPVPLCPDCGSHSVTPQPVSGFGHVVSYTVNHHKWREDFPVPYVIAVVEMEEQCGLRLTSNIVGCSPDAVVMDMQVRVVFEKYGELYIPLFSPTLT
jgi:uncharacterized OB-fold protein